MELLESLKIATNMVKNLLCLTSERFLSEYFNGLTLKIRIRMKVSDWSLCRAVEDHLLYVDKIQNRLFEDSLENPTQGFVSNSRPQQCFISESVDLFKLYE